jgi:hypothetical protein
VRPFVVGFALVLATASQATAHVPGTAIGQAVEVLRDVPVSYENGAAVSDLEADAFGRLPGVGDGIFVAAMPGSALQEIQGGPGAVAAEIAREAPLHGTLIVLVGRRLGAWSDEVAEARLHSLVVQAAQRSGDGAIQVATLASSIQAEPKSTPSSDGPPWALIVGALVLLAGLGALALVLGHRARTRRL